MGLLLACRFGRAPPPACSGSCGRRGRRCTPSGRAARRAARSAPQGGAGGKPCVCVCGRGVVCKELAPPQHRRRCLKRQRHALRTQLSAGRDSGATPGSGATRNPWDAPACRGRAWRRAACHRPSPADSCGRVAARGALWEVSRRITSGCMVDSEGGQAKRGRRRTHRLAMAASQNPRSSSPSAASTAATSSWLGQYLGCAAAVAGPSPQSLATASAVTGVVGAPAKSRSQLAVLLELAVSSGSGTLLLPCMNATRLSRPMLAACARRSKAG